MPKSKSKDKKKSINKIISTKSQPESQKDSKKTQHSQNNHQITLLNNHQKDNQKIDSLHDRSLLLANILKEFETISKSNFDDFGWKQKLSVVLESYRDHPNLAIKILMLIFEYRRCLLFTNYGDSSKVMGIFPFLYLIAHNY
jgi:hypothetical protein